MEGRFNLLKKIIRPKALQIWMVEQENILNKDYVGCLENFVLDEDCKREIEKYNRGQKYLEKLQKHFKRSNNEINVEKLDFKMSAKCIANVIVLLDIYKKLAIKYIVVIQKFCKCVFDIYLIYF